MLPSLMMGYWFDEVENAVSERVWVENRGLGPAFFEKINIIKGQETFENGLHGYFQDIDVNEGSQSVRRFYPNLIIPATDAQ